MHPEVTGDAPGGYPICHMALELKSSLPRESSSATGTSPGTANEEVSSVVQRLSLSPEAANLVHYSVGLARGHVLPQELHAPAWFEGDGVVAALLYKDEIEAIVADEAAVFSRDLADAGLPVIVQSPLLSGTGRHRGSTSAYLRVRQGSSGASPGG
jgi:hypothetical protein